MRAKNKAVALLKIVTDQQQLSPCEDGFHQLDFIQVALKELLSNRLALRNSFAYGYFIPDGEIKIMFEQLQDEMERYTERLSDMVGRKIIVTPKSQIITTALIARRKREVGLLLHHAYYLFKANNHISVSCGLWRICLCT